MKEKEIKQVFEEIDFNKMRKDCLLNGWNCGLCSHRVFCNYTLEPYMIDNLLIEDDISLLPGVWGDDDIEILKEHFRKG